MKIIYLHQYFKTPSMSGGTRSYEMARRLARNGHEVHVVTSWQGDTLEKGWFYEGIDNVNVHWLPVPYSNSMGFAARIKAFFRFAFLAGKKAAEIGGDLVFATSTPLTIAIPGVFASKKINAPMVFEVRDLWPEIPIALGVLNNPVSIYLARKLELFAYNNAERIIALSQGMADGVAASGFPRNKIAIIPNSSDVALFGPQTRNVESDFFIKSLGKKPSKVVLYPGTLGRVNDVGYLVDVASAVAKQSADIDFVVIGDGAERESIQAKAKERGVLGVNFHMLAPIPKTELVSAFASADLIVSLCLPLKELEANSANKFFDALASATPIAVNYGGWQKDLIMQHGCGLTIDNDIESSSQNLISFLEDEVRISSASKSAFDLATEKFDRDVLAIQFEEFLTGAV